MQNVLYAILVLGCMGAVFGLMLAIASKVFAVKTDPRLEPLIEALPGANCGGCGYSGCAGYAQAVLEGKARIGKCAAGGKECADAMAKIMGQEPVEMERMVAVVMCSGVDAVPKGVYEGLHDCISASRVAGKGPMLCEYGCLGFLVAIVLFASIREHTEDADCPKAFRGFPIALISAGLLALAFMGFSGMKIFG